MSKHWTLKRAKEQRRRDRKVKDRVGPTFVATFEDGQVKRMSTFTTLTELDVERGVRLSHAAYEARAQRLGWLYPVPSIVGAHFEQGGMILAVYSADALQSAGGGQ